MLLLAHASDIHIDSDERSAERAGRVVRYLARLPTPPDALLVTGDLADHGEPAEYEVVRALFDELPFPVLFCPGNHDVREPYRKALLRDDSGAVGPVDRAYEIGGVLILMVDSSIPGRHDGLLSDDTLAWLDVRLAARPGMPALIAFHHPPVVLGMPFVDGIRQFEEQRLAALVERHPQIVALLCGHAHTPAATTFAGRPLIVAPGVVSTSMLPFETDAIVDPSLPPMIAFHLIETPAAGAEGARLTSHFRVMA
ncbi:phosphodiesterase [Actinoplanes sp. TBRC 11911]|uniref:phosphodiesterase n=1 Tax=Actinoplanes sp. TBRC 11911 TaxID=2729386 RepID=UPI00145EE6EF|nr:phosphodiesterase [Actinoplanes sp. TBRC 11911]NMO51204.1 phosphodiesterase [Actinoplanes sp. TBRC 11911]